MTEQQAARWTATRAKGRGRFILVNGVLMWGLLTGLAWAFVMSAMQGWERLPVYLVGALIGFPIGGYFFGSFLWKRTEEEYAKALSDQTTHEQSVDRIQPIEGNDDPGRSR